MVKIIPKYLVFFVFKFMIPKNKKYIFLSGKINLKNIVIKFDNKNLENLKSFFYFLFCFSDEKKKRKKLRFFKKTELNFEMHYSKQNVLFIEFNHLL